MKTPELLFYRLGNRVTAFSTTRNGGCSTGNYGRMNINAYCGDNLVSVENNRKALCKLLDIPADRLVMPQQTHGTIVRQVGEELFTLSETMRERVLMGIDSLITAIPNVCIGVSTADCIPVILYDEEHHAAASVHAGWRGTVNRIVQKTVAEMGIAFQTAPQSLRVVIGPGISLAHFEVGEEVYQAFSEAGFDMQKIACRYAKWHIDLWECNRMQLLEMGVSAANISLSGICTYTNSRDYFSARRLGINSGRLFTGIILGK